MIELPHDCPPWVTPFIVRTQRLVLAPCCAAGAQQLARIMQAPQVHEPFFVGRPQLAQLQAEPGQWQQHEGGWQARREFNLVARLADGGEVVGCVQFFPQLIAYFVAPHFWQQGYGSEMVAASCVDVPRLLGIRTLESGVIRENIGSRRILEKSGFRFSGLDMRPWQGRSGKVAMLWYRRQFA